MNEPALDALTSATLKNLREHWWNDEFTAFLHETLRPRPGNRILDVGCGEGAAEISIGRLHLSQIRLFGIDQMLNRVIVARFATASHNQRVGFAAADACCLPFLNAIFDSTYCVAVLQHVRALAETIGEMARVTRANGRLVIVEPDNAARYWFSSVPSGADVWAARSLFFTATGDHLDGNVGARVVALLERNHIEPLSVRLFPVSQTRVGAPRAAEWTERLSRVQKMVDAADAVAKAAGRDYLDTLKRYAADAEQAGAAFVEIQNTLLFATVGQKI